MLSAEPAGGGGDSRVYVRSSAGSRVHAGIIVGLLLGMVLLLLGQLVMGDIMMTLGGGGPVGEGVLVAVDVLL